MEGKGKKVIILSIMSPNFALDFNWADEVLLGYSWSSYTLEAMAGALAGEYNAEGVLPFSVKN